VFCSHRKLCKTQDLVQKGLLVMQSSLLRALLSVMPWQQQIRLLSCEVMLLGLQLQVRSPDFSLNPSATF